jgi:hypothetical protein
VLLVRLKQKRCISLMSVVEYVEWYDGFLCCEKRHAAEWAPVEIFISECGGKREICDWSVWLAVFLSDLTPSLCDFKKTDMIAAMDRSDPSPCLPDIVPHAVTQASTLRWACPRGVRRRWYYFGGVHRGNGCNLTVQDNHLKECVITVGGRIVA